MWLSTLPMRMSCSWKEPANRLRPMCLSSCSDRLTTMPEANEGLSLSGDGNRLVFCVANRTARIALYPVDPAGRAIAGPPEFATGTEVHSVSPDLTR